MWRILGILSIAAILSAWFVWHSKKTKNFYVGFYLTGFISSIVLGLSESPLLPAFATGIFSVMAAAVVLWKSPSLIENVENSISSLTFPLSLILAGAIVGLPLGIVMKANDVLSVESSSGKERVIQINAKEIEPSSSGTNLRAGESSSDSASTLWTLHATNGKSQEQVVAGFKENASGDLLRVINALEEYDDGSEFLYGVFELMAKHEE